MTGNIRQGIGLLVLAAVVGLIGVIALTANAPDAGGLMVLGAVVLVVVGGLRIFADLMKPQRD